MRTACLINHFQYGDYVGEAVDSVLAQTRALDEIVVVDDGSSTEHLAKVRAAAGGNERIRLIEKENGGQLSCFEVGLAESSAEVVFFLDADDVWEPDHVATVVDLLERRPDVDFVAVNRRMFFPDGTESVEGVTTRDLGYSIVHCLHKRSKGGAWVGAPTSCLAIRRPVLDRILPVPNPDAWRVGADRVLVYGSSLAGARKYVIGEPLVRYRVHGSNAYYGNDVAPDLAFTSRVEGRRLSEHLCRRLSLPASLIDLADYEFRTIESPTRKEYHAYRALVRESVSPWRLKRRLYRALAAHYRSSRKG